MERIDLYQVIEEYFGKIGKWDTKRVVATTVCLADAEEVVKAFECYKANRPFKYSIERKFSFAEVPFGVDDTSSKEYEEILSNLSEQSK